MGGVPTTTVMWFRRDLRLADNPALRDACESDGVLPLFVLDPALWRPASASRRWYLTESLRALDGSLRRYGAGLSVLAGDPVDQVVAAARAVGADRVHVAADYGPYGHQRDVAVEKALAAAEGIELVRTGSPYGNPIPGMAELGVTDAPEVFREGNEQLQDVVRRQSVPTRVVIERMSEEIQKDVEMMGTLRQAGIQPGAEVSVEAGGLGVRLSAEGWPDCEIDREASTHLFVSRV